MSKSDNRRVVVIVLLIALVMVALALLFPTVRQSVFGGDTGRIVTLPVISSSVADSRGVSHNVQTRFAVELTPRGQQDISQDELYSRINTIMDTLSFDKIDAKGNVNYIRQQVSAGLARDIPTEYIAGIYISDIMSNGQPLYQDVNALIEQRNNNLFNLFEGFGNR